MKGLFIFLIFFFLVVGGAIVLVYYFYERPITDIRENQIFCNLSISTLEHGNKIETGFKIVGLVVDVNSKTNDKAYTREYVVANSSFVIYTYNLDEQQYYTSYLNIDKCDANEVKRIDLELLPYGKVNMSYTGSLSSGDSIVLNISVVGLIKAPEICISWPAAIITIFPKEALQETIIPIRLDTVNKCYSFSEDIVDSSKSIILEYSKFGTLLSADYLGIYLVDGDYIYTDTIHLADNKNGVDVGMKDIQLKVK